MPSKENRCVETMTARRSTLDNLRLPIKPNTVADTTYARIIYIYYAADTPLLGLAWKCESYVSAQSHKQ